MDPHELRAKLAEAASQLGFDVFGVASVQPADDDRDRLREWLARGYHASMGWMSRDPDKRTDVERALPGARSVISVAINYYSPRNGDESCGCLKVARYAWGEDYHEVVGEKLRALQKVLAELTPGAESVACVDTAPIMEKSWAARAGVGWVGRSGNLITRDLGSWVFLGEIITTAVLPSDTHHEDYCGSCTRCIDACPTEAIVEPYVVDSNKCIAYWTIEHRGEFPDGIAEDFDGWIFGCDVCQDVCPWNRFGQPTRESRFEARCDCVCPPGTDWARMTEAEFREAFAKSAIKRTKHEGLTRNIRSQTRDPLREILSAGEWEPPVELSDITVDGLGISTDSPDPKSS